MGNKLYVGNLPFSLNDQDLQNLFEEVGQVLSAKIVMDRDTGRSKGFGFVEMGSEEDAQEAISRFNGNEVQGRTLKVNEAKPRESRPSFGGGGGGGGRSFNRGGDRGDRRGGGGHRRGGGGFNRSHDDE